MNMDFAPLSRPKAEKEYAKGSNSIPIASRDNDGPNKGKWTKITIPKVNVNETNPVETPTIDPVTKKWRVWIS